MWKIQDVSLKGLKFGTKNNPLLEYRYEEQTGGGAKVPENVLELNAATHTLKFKDVKIFFANRRVGKNKTPFLAKELRVDLTKMPMTCDSRVMISFLYSIYEVIFAEYFTQRDVKHLSIVSEKEGTRELFLHGLLFFMMRWNTTFSLRYAKKRGGETHTIVISDLRSPQTMAQIDALFEINTRREKRTQWLLVPMLAASLVDLEDYSGDNFDESDPRDASIADFLRFIHHGDVLANDPRREEDGLFTLLKALRDPDVTWPAGSPTKYYVEYLAAGGLLNATIGPDYDEDPKTWPFVSGKDPVSKLYARLGYRQEEAHVRVAELVRNKLDCLFGMAIRKLARTQLSRYESLKDLGLLSLDMKKYVGRDNPLLPHFAAKPLAPEKKKKKLGIVEAMSEVVPLAVEEERDVIAEDFPDPSTTTSEVEDEFAKMRMLHGSTHVKVKQGWPKLGWQEEEPVDTVRLTAVGALRKLVDERLRSVPRGQFAQKEVASNNAEWKVIYDLAENSVPNKGPAISEGRNIGGAGFIDPNLV